MMQKAFPGFGGRLFVVFYLFNFTKNYPSSDLWPVVVIMVIIDGLLNINYPFRGQYKVNVLFAQLQEVI